MPPSPFNSQRQEAFRDLLDDPSPIVRKGLLDEFSRIGTPAIDFLESLARGSNRMLASHARRLLEELKNANPSEDFRRFIRSLNYELETGTIMLCRVAYPQLKASDICDQIESIAQRCRELLIKPSSSRDRCVVINRVLFHEMGFRGNAEDYENPDNSYLNRVLETRKGLPITLSILYILVAQRLGAELDPIAYPGHFLVGSFEDDLPFYIDAFRRGKFSTPGQLLQYTDGQISVTQLGNLAPSPIREVLTRCCRNLVNHYKLRNQDDMAQLFNSFVLEFQRCHQKQTS
ncbi:transglutaminase-like domain-containing protein [Pelagicoccus sp. SDUM812003]|uniref:transglutaminase-like domain-containing protein n=1 Tax=Pelagicoccus sp. SDUM812003 TaxID=3041267 RepID=UPI0028100894|nr:transglutaminase-like domain-containing protein [Pelagicoccus sp. SDUM812003]MDQ8203372.1 transglutaminase-like domain-containing protein [Pelagicoccus sp. SDUM812003]